MDDWLLRHLVCPIDKSPLERVGQEFRSEAGRRYPIVDDVPVMLVGDVEQTMDLVSASLARARGLLHIVDQRAPQLYLESLGISEQQKEGVARLSKQRNLVTDPVVQFIVAATSGYSYKHLVGNLNSYPIPELRLPRSNGGRLLDVGCNWGRWSISAARMGYRPIGLDPSLGAVMAARRVARQLGLDMSFVVGDARWLPFKTNSFDAVFSYSVLQHFSKPNTRISLREIASVLKNDGTALLQMSNALGLRSLQHQLNRGFRKAKNFEVRYWTVPELRSTFEEVIGPARISADCYLGLGLQASDYDLLTPLGRFLVRTSELLRVMSKHIPVLVHVADSLYVEARRRGQPLEVASTQGDALQPSPSGSQQ